MKTKAILIGLIVLAIALPVGLASAQEATEEAPVVEDSRQHPIRDILREVMDIVTEATGLTQTEVVQQMRDGATLSEIITANGGDAEVIKAEVTSLITERIEIAVTNDRITRTVADEMLAKLPERISQIFDEVHDLEGRPFNRTERGLFREFIQTVSDATDLTGEEIAQAVQDGAHLSEVITANGGDVEAIKTEVLTAASERVNERVSNGDITQEEADAILAQAEEELNGWLSGELEFPLFDRPFGGEGRGGRGGRGGGNGNGQGDN